MDKTSDWNVNDPFNEYKSKNNDSNWLNQNYHNYSSTKST